MWVQSTHGRKLLLFLQTEVLDGNPPKKSKSIKLIVEWCPSIGCTVQLVCLDCKKETSFWIINYPLFADIFTK